MSFKTILVAGASHGIGLAVAEHFGSQCDRLLAASRSARHRLRLPYCLIILFHTDCIELVD